MEKELIINLINKGFSISKISKETGKSISSIRHWMKKFKLKTKNPNVKERKILPKLPKTEKNCPKCKILKPENEFYKRRNGTDNSTYCKICTGEQTTNRQKNIKIKCVEYKGGKCYICQYDKYIGALDFHHLDPTKKDFSIGKLKNYSFSDKIKNELDKCILVCSNCHREIHAKIIVVPQGIEPQSKN